MQNNLNLATNSQPVNQIKKNYLIWKIANLVLAGVFLCPFLLILYHFEFSADSPIGYIIYAFTLIPQIIAFVIAIKEFRQEISFTKWFLCNLIPLIALFSFILFNTHRLFEKVSILGSFYLPLLPPIGHEERGFLLSLILLYIYIALIITRPKKNFQSWFFYGIGIAFIATYYFLQQTPLWSFNNLAIIGLESKASLCSLIIGLLSVFVGIICNFEKIKQLFRPSRLRIILGLSVIIFASFFTLDLITIKSSYNGESTNGRIITIKQSESLSGIKYENIIYGPYDSKYVYITDTNAKTPVKLPEQGTLSPNTLYYAYFSYDETLPVEGCNNFNTFLDLNIYNLLTNENYEINIDEYAGLGLPKEPIWLEGNNILIEYRPCSGAETSVAFSIDGKVIDPTNLKEQNIRYIRVISPSGKYRLITDEKAKKSEEYLTSKESNKIIKLPYESRAIYWLQQSDGLFFFENGNLSLVDMKGNYKKLIDEKTIKSLEKNR